MPRVCSPPSARSCDSSENCPWATGGVLLAHAQGTGKVRAFSCPYSVTAPLPQAGTTLSPPSSGPGLESHPCSLAQQLPLPVLLPLPPTHLPKFRNHSSHTRSHLRVCVRGTQPKTDTRQRTDPSISIGRERFRRDGIIATSWGMIHIRKRKDPLTQISLSNCAV